MAMSDTQQPQLPIQSTKVLTLYLPFEKLLYYFFQHYKHIMSITVLYSRNENSVIMMNGEFGQWCSLCVNVYVNCM